VTSKEEYLLDCPAEDAAPDIAAGLFQPLPAAMPVTVEQMQKISPSALAYLGDAVYELYVRSCYLLPPKRSQTYHRLVVAQVRAETQAVHLRSLTPHLNNTELEIVRRGRNAASGRPRRVDPEIYQQATSLETLIGYLYLTNQRRLTQLLAQLKLESNLEE
jgi:ribonuclease-3 family protein